MHKKDKKGEIPASTGLIYNIALLSLVDQLNPGFSLDNPSAVTKIPVHRLFCPHGKRKRG